MQMYQNRKKLIKKTLKSNHKSGRIVSISKRRHFADVIKKSRLELRLPSLPAISPPSFSGLFYYMKYCGVSRLFL